jgi:hypothetical protein
MLSEKQLAANRANAQKSTGPATEAGKQRSRLNATRHGLTGQTVVMPHEDMEAFNNFTAAIVASLQAVGALETQLAQSYAGFQWRINRAAALEETMFTLGIMEEIAENLNIEHPEAHNATSNAKTFRADAKEFDKLSMYSQRLVNQAGKVLKQLTQLQAERRQREKSEMAEALAIYKAHRAQNATFDPQANGFALTIDKIKAHIHRQNLSNPSYIADKLDLARASTVPMPPAAAAIE